MPGTDEAVVEFSLQFGFRNFTATSRNLPKCGTLGGKVYHEIEFSLVKVLMISLNSPSIISGLNSISPRQTLILVELFL